MGWNEDLLFGKQHEELIDEYIRSLGIEVTEVPRELERCGVGDRYWSKNGVITSVEYKTDKTAQYTSNLFCEIQQTRQPGWAYTTTAQYLVYWVLPSDLYLIPMIVIKEHLPDWELQFAQRTTWDGSTGILVPFPYLRENYVREHHELFDETFIPF